jgi:holo-[acyl-carrier protein] synthase
MIGIDIVEIDDIESCIRDSSRFVRRVFTEYERDYCESRGNKFQHYAVRFAAKEALMKALGTGWNDGVQWTQIETRNIPSGCPKIYLYENAHKIAKKMNVKSINLSLSHSCNYAIAIVLISV